MPSKSIKVIIGSSETPIKQRPVQVSALNTCLAITQTDRTLRALVTEHLKSFKLSMPEWLLLGVVAGADGAGLSIQATAQALNVTPPQVTTMSSRLVAVHLLRQKRTQRHDHRSRHLLLTARARAMLDDIEGVVSNALADWFKIVPDNHLVFYRRVNETLAKQHIPPKTKSVGSQGSNR